MFGSWHGEMLELQLFEGDTIAIVSDGVLEAGQPKSADFGDSGVVNCLRRSRNASAEEAVQRILSEADRCGATDDMTAVVLRVM
jgi:serine phosphatase RsbU (regulator of sigma subunit)